MHETYKEFRHLDSVGPVRIIQVSIEIIFLLNLYTK